MEHVLAHKCHVFIPCLLRFPLDVGLEILNHECSPFWPNFVIFPISGHIGIFISLYAPGPRPRGKPFLVVYDPGSNAM